MSPLLFVLAAAGGAVGGGRPIGNAVDGAPAYAHQSVPLRAELARE